MSYHLETKNPTDRPTTKLTPIYPLKLRLWGYNYTAYQSDSGKLGSVEFLCLFSIYCTINIYNTTSISKLIDF